jgi:hypothetical protein
VAAMLMFLHRLQLVAVIMIMIMIMIVIVIVIVIVISLGFVRVKGIAHWVASGKVPVAK